MKCRPTIFISNLDISKNINGCFENSIMVCWWEHAKHWANREIRMQRNWKRNV